MNRIPKKSITFIIFDHKLLSEKKSNMNDEEIYKEARQKVNAKKGFFAHLLTFALIIGMLYFIICYEAGGPLLPVVVVAMSWGIGLGIHYLKTFGTEHLDFLGFESDWEEQELQKEVERLERKRELKDRLKNEKSLLDDSEPLKLKEIVKKPLRRDMD